MSCIVYVACKMTGRDRHEQVHRAKFICSILRQYGLTPISPVLIENVEDKKGPLVNDNRERLSYFWRRDKDIIRYQAHVVLIDGAHEKSFGVEREYMLNRGVLWKPTVLLMPPTGLTVVDFEDDLVTFDPHEAGRIIRDRWGTQAKRVKWRIGMLSRSLPGWIRDQLFAWR